MDHASLPDHVAGDYRAGRVGYFGLGGHAETGIPGVHHPPRRGRGCLPRGDFRRGGGAVGQAFERYLFTFKEVKKKKKDVLHVKGWNGVHDGGAERRREQ